MKDLLKTLWKPDREENPEQSVVAQAANILQTGEFQVLQLAYREWHGHDMTEEVCNEVFRLYMIQGDIPGWARHYSRRILEAEGRGLIDDSDLAYHRYDQNYVTHVPEGVKHFVWTTLVLAVLMVGSFMIAELAGVEPTSLTPPFFDRSELVPRGQ